MPTHGMHMTDDLMRKHDAFLLVKFRVLGVERVLDVHLIFRDKI